jgi:hypothetical protein
MLTGDRGIMNAKHDIIFAKTSILLTARQRFSNVLFWKRHLSW